MRYAVFSGLAPYNPIYVDNPLRLGGFWGARLMAIKIVGMDLRLLLLPVTLLSDHSFDAITPSTVSDTGAWLSLLAVIAILAVVCVRRRKDSMPFWAAGFFAIALLPTSNLIVLIGSIFAERFLYLPAMGYSVLVAGLLYRMKNELVFRGLLIALIAVYAARTVIRNPDWDDNIALASADLPEAPRSFRLHYMMARALYQQDAAGNIDRAIAENEAAVLILSALPPSKSIAFPGEYLGAYYATKADLVGPGQRTEWLERSRSTLLKAREISQAIEQEYDGVQQAHGVLLVRATDQQLYLFLADTDMKLGRYQDAVEALRYAQGINPGQLDVYDRMSKAYTAMGQPAHAVIAIEEKALVDKFQGPTMRDLQGLYRQIAEGQCAFVPGGAGWQLNVDGCPRLKVDFCGASAELAQAYRDARIPEGVQWAQAAGKQQFGCPAP